MTSPFLPSGTVYGVLLNDPSELAALGEAVNQAPYKAAPRAPVLYIKPANTFTANGRNIALPDGHPDVEVGASVGLVIGEDGQPGGWLLLNDLSVPHSSFFRPPVRFKCLDGFLGVGSTLRPLLSLRESQAFELSVSVNGSEQQRVRFAQMARNAEQLLADVTGFMTLLPGDVLMLGCGHGRPLVRAGDTIRIECNGFEPLSNRLVGAA